MEEAKFISFVPLRVDADSSTRTTPIPLKFLTIFNHNYVTAWSSLIMYSISFILKICKITLVRFIYLELESAKL